MFKKSLLTWTPYRIYTLVYFDIVTKPCTGCQTSHELKIFMQPLEYQQVIVTSQCPKRAKKRVPRGLVGANASQPKQHGITTFGKLHVCGYNKLSVLNMLRFCSAFMWHCVILIICYFFVHFTCMPFVCSHAGISACSSRVSFVQRIYEANNKS